MNLTRAELVDALSRITYKPGYSFALFEHPHEGVWLRIEATVTDAVSGDRLDRPRGIDLGIDVPIPPLDTIADFHRWLHWRLTRHEIHESCEWFKVDGVAVFNPHEVTA